MSKGEGIISAPLEAVVALVRDIERRNKWDEMLATGAFVEVFTEGCAVVHLSYKAIWPTSSRDFCAVTIVHSLSDTEKVIVATSAVHPKCPPVKGAVRGELIVGGFLLKALDDDRFKCHMTYLTQADPKGNIPSSIKNAVAVKQPLCIHEIRQTLAKEDLTPYIQEIQSLEKRKQETLKQEEERKQQEILKQEEEERKQQQEILKQAEEQRQQEILERQELAKQKELFKKAEDEQRKKEEQAKEIPNNQKENTQLKEEKTQRKKDNVDTEEKKNVEEEKVEEPKENKVGKARLGSVSPSGSYGNLEAFLPSASEMNEEDFRELIDVAVKELMEMVHSNRQEGWKSPTVKDGVVIMRRESKQNHLYTFRGVGEIQAPAQQILETCLDLSRAAEWDVLFKKAEPVQEINSQTRIVRIVYQTRMCLVKAARDFCILWHWQQTEEGAFVIIGRSVAHPDCPPQPGCIRGEIKASGYYIQPKRDDPTSSTVSYISQVNLKGLPTTVINLVSERQPLVIAGIRKFLTGPDRKSVV